MRFGIRKEENGSQSKLNAAFKHSLQMNPMLTPSSKSLSSTSKRRQRRLLKMQDSLKLKKKSKNARRNSRDLRKKEFKRRKEPRKKVKKQDKIVKDGMKNIMKKPKKPT